MTKICCAHSHRPPIGSARRYRRASLAPRPRIPASSLTMAALSAPVSFRASAPAASFRRAAARTGARLPAVRARARLACAAAAKNYNVTLLPGDGIGPEIMKVAKEVLMEVGSQHDIAFDFTEALVGGAAIDATGVPLPPETLATCQASDAVLLAAIGGYADRRPTTHRAPPPLATSHSRGAATSPSRPLHPEEASRRASPASREDSSAAAAFRLRRDSTTPALPGFFRLGGTSRPRSSR